jgi:hypothetical protein
MLDGRREVENDARVIVSWNEMLASVTGDVQVEWLEDWVITTASTQG